MYDKFMKLLEERGLTVYKVSQMTGIAQSTFSDWKNREGGNLSVENLKKLAEKLDVPVSYFLED